MMGYLRFLAANPLFLSFGFGLNVFVALGQTFYFSLFNADIQATLGLTHGELAGIYGTATIVGSVGVFYLGRLLDQVDLRLFVCMTTIAVAIGCWAFAAATTLPAIFGGILLIRLTAQGLWGTTVQVSMARYFDAERGKAAAVANTGYALGFAVFPLIGAWLIAEFDWRTAWRLTGAFVLLVILPIIVIQLRGHGDRHRRYEARLEALAVGPSESRVRQWTLGEVLGDARFWLIQPAMVVVPSIIFSIQFHQLYIVTVRGWDLTAFAGGYSLYAAVSLAATLAGGILVDRFGSRRLISGYLWPLIPAMIVLGQVEHPAAIPVLMTLTGLVFGFGLVVFVTLWAELYGTKFMGAIRSFNVFFNVMCASLVMVITGWLIDIGVTITAMCNGGMLLVAISLLLLAADGRVASRRGSDL